MRHHAVWLSPGHPLTPSSRCRVRLQLQTELQSPGHHCLHTQNRQSFLSKGKKWWGRMSEEVEGGEGREGKGRGGERELIYAIILDQSMANTYLHHKKRHAMWLPWQQKRPPNGHPWQQCHAENCAITHCVVLLLLCHCKTGKVVCEAGNNLFCPAVTSFDCVSRPATVSVVVEHTTRSYWYIDLEMRLLYEGEGGGRREMV